jgi:hypothetical protein
MKLTLRFRGIPPTPTLRDQVRRRLAFALSRFATEVRAVDVLVADLNGPRGGVDKLCRMRLVASTGELVIDERDTSLEAAVSLAAGRAARTLARTLDRRLALHRPGGGP